MRCLTIVCIFSAVCGSCDPITKMMQNLVKSAEMDIGKKIKTKQQTRLIGCLLYKKWPGTVIAGPEQRS